MSEKLNIHQKMLQATMNIGRVKKNLSVGFGQGSYKAVSEIDVLNAVKSVEIELGIYSYPYSRNITETAVLVNVNKDGRERKEQFMRIETVYRFVNIDDKSDYIDVTTYGDGIDGGDKAPGKAMTYADKYALLKAYKIETGDDPDKDESKEYTKVEKKDPVKKEEPTVPVTKVVADLILQSVRDADHLKTILDYYGVGDVMGLNNVQASQVVNKLLHDKKK